jgi:hypothetical protein
MNSTGHYALVFGTILVLLLLLIYFWFFVKADTRLWNTILLWDIFLLVFYLLFWKDKP